LPLLALACSTGNGSGPFGLGWQLSLPGISRRTSLGMPRYRDMPDPTAAPGSRSALPFGAGRSGSAPTPPMASREPSRSTGWPTGRRRSTVSQLTSINVVGIDEQAPRDQRGAPDHVRLHRFRPAGRRFEGLTGAGLPTGPLADLDPGGPARVRAAGRPRTGPAGSPVLAQPRWRPVRPAADPGPGRGPGPWPGTAPRRRPTSPTRCSGSPTWPVTGCRTWSWYEAEPHLLAEPRL